MTNQMRVIIFSGFNPRAVIAFIRTLESVGVSYSIIAASSDDFIFQTVYRVKVDVIRKNRILEINDVLDAIRQVSVRHKADTYLIAPSTEALNRFLLDNRKLVEVGNVILPLVEKSLYEKISDKDSFGKLCRKYNILVPDESYQIEEMEYPFVAKPREYFAGSGEIYSPYLIFNESDKIKFLEECPVSDFYYQKFIHGESYYLLYYFPQKEGRIYKFSQKNLMQQPDGKSIVAAIPARMHETLQSSLYEHLFSSVKFRGLVMIEVRKDVGGNFYMIEANPRFWGPSQLFVDAGMNLFEAFLSDYGFDFGKPDFQHPDYNVKYFWFNGIFAAGDQNKKVVTYGNFSLDSCWKDWLKEDVYLREDSLDFFKSQLNERLWKI